MRHLILYLFLMITLNIHAQGKYAIVIHGGAGTILPETISEERREAYEKKMTEALKTGEKILANGGSAEEAVVETIRILEDSPLFNAGRGAVMTWDTICELDASIMRGSDMNAGAVAGVSHIKSPIAAAAKVMDESPHIMLSGKGAEEFARAQKLQMVKKGYFETEAKKKILEDRKKNMSTGAVQDSLADWKYGTVGCVALDKEGNIAAGTSTGGMTAKRYGRIGDSPVIGAGTYADNNTAGISCTGHGEYFIRYSVAYDVTALMKYAKLDVKTAADSVIFKKLLPIGGMGGLIALDKNGNIAMPFNTPGMFRAYVKEDEKPVVLMFKNEEE